MKQEEKGQKVILSKKKGSFSLTLNVAEGRKHTEINM